MSEELTNPSSLKSPYRTLTIWLKSAPPLSGFPAKSVTALAVVPHTAVLAFTSVRGLIVQVRVFVPLPLKLVTVTPVRLEVLPLTGSENTTWIPVICQGSRFRVEPAMLKLDEPNSTLYAV